MHFFLSVGFCLFRSKTCISGNQIGIQSDKIQNRIVLAFQAEPKAARPATILIATPPAR